MTGQMKTRKQSDKASAMFRKDRLHLNNDGVAGYFEDLPKLLFILFAVGLFVTSTVIVYGSYNRFNEHTQMMDNLNTFSNDVLNWDNITLNNEGVLNGNALNNMDIDDWEYQFPPEVKYFEYQIIVMDRSQYNLTYGLERQDYGPISTEARPVGVDIYSKSTPVVILDADGNYRASYLVVAIWR